MMRKRRSSFFFAIWQRDPRLDRMHWSTFASSSLKALRVSDAAAGDHPIHLTRPDRLLHPDGVAADMRMWKYVSFTRQTFWQIDRAHMIEKNKRPDHAPLRCRQQPPDLEAADVADSS